MNARPTGDDLALLSVAEAASLLRVRDDFLTDELVAGRLKGFPWPRPRPGDPPRLRRSWRVPRWAIRDWQTGMTEATPHTGPHTGQSAENGQIRPLSGLTRERKRSG